MPEGWTWRGWWISAGLIVAIGAGCRARPESPAYLPSWDEARSAVQQALSAWRDRDPAPGDATVTSYRFVDKQRGDDERLRSFAILGTSDVENVRQFLVRLEVEGRETPRLVRYNVLGRNPCWVFRLEDFEQICHWEHPMDDAPAPAEIKAEEPAGGRP